MKLLIIILLLLHSFQTSSGTIQHQRSTTLPTIDPLARITDCKAYNYIQSIYPHIQRVNLEYGIPEAIVMAQAIQESGFGTSNLAVNFNNHLGLRKHHKYCHYKNETNCFNHYGRTLSQHCYKNLSPKTLVEWYDALLCCKYAPDSIYVIHLDQLIKQYNL